MDIGKLTEHIGANIDVTQCDKLFNAIGWRERGEDTWRNVLSKSDFVYTLWDGSDLVAMGRTLTDGVMCMIYDIGVLPQHHSQGLGTRVMKAILTHVKDKGYASVGLFPWEDSQHRYEVPNVAFYQKFGFVNMGGMECPRVMKPE